MTSMRSKNFIIFLLLAVPIVAAWVWLQVLFPPPATPEKKDEPVAQVAKKDEPKKEEKKAEPPAKKKEEKKPAPVAPAQDEPLKEITIGGDSQSDFYIEAVLTSLGAGVRRLSLNRFEAANWLGRPEPGKALQLIGDDPFEPSFRMYHYVEGSAKEPPVYGLGEKHWKYLPTRKDGPAQEVAFATTVPGAPHVEITKTYRLEPRSYHLTLTLSMRDTREAGAGPPTPFRYQVTGGHGLPVEGEWYTGVFRNALIALVESGSVYRTLETSDHISYHAGGKDERASGRQVYVQYAGVVNQYFGSVVLPDDKQPSPSEGGGDFRDLIDWVRPTQESSEVKGVILDLNKDKEGVVRELVLQEPGKDGKIFGYQLLERVRVHLKEAELRRGERVVLSYYETPGGTRVATWVRLGQTPRAHFDDITVRVNSQRVELKPGGAPVAHRYLLYHGPVKTRMLAYQPGNDAVSSELVSRYTDTLHLRTLTDYRSPGVMGSISQSIFLTDIIIVFTRLMHWLLWLLSFLMPHSLSGLSVILLTVLVRGAMYPISRRTALISVKTQALQPEIKKIQEKYKNDPQAKTQAMMELWRKHNIHPLGSCLPLLLQMPIFMGLYFSLQESIQFRLAPFLWIRNLAAPDMLLWWGQSIPFISDPDSMGGIFYLGPYLNALPILAAVLMVIQQKLMTPPAVDEQQEAQQKMMRYMSAVFCLMFYRVPAGVCIYFISSSLWGLAERQLLPRKQTTVAVEGAEGGGYGPQAGPRGPQGGPRRGGRNQPKKAEKDGGTLQKLKDLWTELLRQAEKK